MRALVILFLWTFAHPSMGNQVIHAVERSSELEATLGYKLSVMDKHDAWRADGLDKIFSIDGAAREYLVRFTVPTNEKLKDIFGLALVIEDENGPLVRAPLAMTRIPSSLHKDEINIEITLVKELLPKSTLHIRCGSGPQETTYTISLDQYEPR